MEQAIILKFDASGSNKAALHLISLGSGFGCKNISVKNSTFVGNTTFNIYAGDASLSTSAADNDSVVISNNIIYRGTTLIGVGGTLGQNNDGWVINNNVFGSTTTSFE